MLKFFKNIRRKQLNENNTGKYLKYAIGEIVLVVVGILIALQLNNWNSNRIQKIDEYKYYENIKDELNEDKGEIIDNIDYNNKDLEKLKYGVQLIENNDRISVDTLGHIAMTLFRYSDVYIQDDLYKSMMNSGEIKLINNSDIIKGLRNLEVFYSYINKMEDIHRDVILQDAVNSLTKSIKFFNNEVQRPDQLYSFEFQNLLLAVIGVMNEKDMIYNRALDEIESVIILIDKELDHQKD